MAPPAPPASVALRAWSAPRRRVPAAGFIPLLCAAAPARAHLGDGAGAPFWDGALHVLTAPLAVAMVIGTAAAVARCEPDRRIECVALLAVIAAAASAWLPQHWSHVAALGAIAVGACAVLDARPSRALAYALTALAGMAVGVASRLDVPGLAAALGAGLAAGLGMAWCVEGLARIGERVPIARRVLGAWVVAIGALTGALAAVR
jgi:hydrogenase/urease accessory protein HupE